MLSATVLKVIPSVIIMHLSELRLSLTFNRSFTIVGSDSEMCVLIFFVVHLQLPSQRWLVGCWV